jgi:hypothetical protein
MRLRAVRRGSGGCPRHAFVTRSVPILILDQYANSAFRNQWGLVVGAIVCGLTSGLFWVSEGAIVGFLRVLSPRDPNLD